MSGAEVFIIPAARRRCRRLRHLRPCSSTVKPCVRHLAGTAHLPAMATPVSSELLEPAAVLVRLPGRVGRLCRGRAGTQQHAVGDAESNQTSRMSVDLVVIPAPRRPAVRPRRARTRRRRRPAPRARRPCASARRCADAARRFRGARTARSARPRCAGARCTSPGRFGDHAGDARLAPFGNRPRHRLDRGQRRVGAGSPGPCEMNHCGVARKPPASCAASNAGSCGSIFENASSAALSPRSTDDQRGVGLPDVHADAEPANNGVPAGTRRCRDGVQLRRRTSTSPWPLRDQSLPPWPGRGMHGAGAVIGGDVVAEQDQGCRASA